MPYQPQLGKTSHIIRLTYFAALGVIVLLKMGVVRSTDLFLGFDSLWRPSLTIISIMISTSVAERLAILNSVAAKLVPRSSQSPVHVFISVFALSALTAAILNNDAAVLLLTPLVVSLIGRCYPNRTDLIIPFAFAVFSAAGVAPLATSNPMNLIIADYAGISFNEYALRMAPIAVVGWFVAYAVLHFLFHDALGRTSHREEASKSQQISLSKPAWCFLIVMVVSLACYPALSFLGGPVWAVAASAAAFGVGVCWRYGVASPTLLASTVSWQIIAFLFCVFVIVLGLSNVGLVHEVSALYSMPSTLAAQSVLIAVSSAVGSAVLNNHPMAILNALAIRKLGHPTHQQVIAALIGGDLGPRLSPMGSLAGLLWFDSLDAMDIHVRVRQFIRVGAAVTIPTLAISLVILVLGPK